MLCCEALLGVGRALNAGAVFGIPFFVGKEGVREEEAQEDCIAWRTW